MILLFAWCLILSPSMRLAEPHTSAFRAALIFAPDASNTRLKEMKRSGIREIALELNERAPRVKLHDAIQHIRENKLGLYYWIEIARNPEMADAHPESMASLQGHPEWRRLFPKAPKPGDGEVIKTYPWTPIYYQETFDAHLKRIANLLKGLPSAKGIFLNDLQAAPSACGCGNIFCRWTTDYGPVTTATHL